MTKWEFLHGSETVSVEGGSWLDALGKALVAAGLDASVLSRLHIDVQPGDHVVIKDPEGRKMVLQPMRDPQLSADPELFNVQPDVETEEIPRTSTGRPLPRRAPPPRATSFRAPAPPPPMARPAPLDPSTAAAPVEADEAATEEELIKKAKKA